MLFAFPIYFTILIWNLFNYSLWYFFRELWFPGASLVVHNSFRILIIPLRLPYNHQVFHYIYQFLNLFIGKFYVETQTHSTIIPINFSIRYRFDVAELLFYEFLRWNFNIKPMLIEKLVWDFIAQVIWIRVVELVPMIIRSFRIDATIIILNFFLLVW